jgi:hypothetical protein
MIDSAVERLAARLARLYIKNTSGTTQKWEKMPADQRSLWRLLARAALDTGKEMKRRPPDCIAVQADRAPADPVSLRYANR